MTDAWTDGVRGVECRGGGERNIDSIITVPADVTVTDHFPPLYLKERRGRGEVEKRQKRGRGRGRGEAEAEVEERVRGSGWKGREGRGEDTHRIN